MRQRKEAFYKLVLSTSFRVGVCSLMVLFGFLYVWQTNTISTKGYVMSDLEKKIQELERETKKLQVDIAQQTSIETLQNRLSGSGLVAVNDVQYMNVLGSAVAKR